VFQTLFDIVSKNMSFKEMVEREKSLLKYEKQKKDPSRGLEVSYSSNTSVDTSR